MHRASYFPLSTESRVQKMNSAVIYTHHQWGALSRTDQRRIFSSHCVHLVGDHNTALMPEMQTWKDATALGQYLPLLTPHLVHGRYLSVQF